MKKIIFTLLSLIVLITLNSCYNLKPTENMDVPVYVSNEMNKIEDSSFVEYSIIEHGDYVYFISNEREIKHIYFYGEINEYFIINIGLFAVLLIISFVLGAICRSLFLN